MTTGAVQADAPPASESDLTSAAEQNSNDVKDAPKMSAESDVPLPPSRDALFDQADDELPPLPPPVEDEESFFQPVSEFDISHLNSDGSAIMDKEMKRKLMDIESSFIPDASPGRDEPKKGLDDTFLFGGSPGNGKSRGEKEALKKGDNSKSGDTVTQAPLSDLPEEDVTQTPADAYKTPAAWKHESITETDAENGDSSNGDMIPPSSPAAAAAERSIRRAASGDDRQAEDDSFAHDETSREEDKEDTHERPSTHKRSTSHASTLKQPFAESVGEDTSRNSLDDSNLSLEDSSLRLSSKASSTLLKRPSFLRNRQASQRSSVSSFTNRSEFSDHAPSEVTVGADYALQTGGAQPAGGSRPSVALSRMASLGSIASSVSGFTEGTSGWGRSIDRVLNKERNLEKLEEHRESSISPPATPRASTSAPPTDTVIANHVQNIRVPDTVAKEYREKHGQDRRFLGSNTMNGRGRNNLTLKEQNSKIDKLSKENFDLKLKIHFLDQALQNRSDEGVKDMISKNVQLQTDLAYEKKENQSLRKKVRELERALKAKEEGEAEARPTSSGSEDDRSNHSELRAEMEEELLYLREVLQHYEVEMDKLKEESLTKEVEKRRMAEYVKTMGERKVPDTSAGVEEAMEMWKDLLEAEQARREQADEDAQKLREENQRLKEQMSQQQPQQQQQNGNNQGVRNYFHITKRHQLSYTTRSQSGSDVTNEQDRNGAMTASTSSTLVDQLRHENAELRRDLGAQTSMLTSRNRERERLQQEIEDLKLNQRRANGLGSVAGDSIFERSISRAHNRSVSRHSGHTRVSQISDNEREEYEKRQAALRDEVAQTKLLNQDLERELNAHLDILTQTEGDVQALKSEREELMEDLQTIQAERDEALLAAQDKEAEFDKLHEEAVTTIDDLEHLIEEKEQELNRIINDLDNRNEDFAALQQEMKTVSSAVVQLEDDRLASQRKIESLENEIEEANRELEALEEQLREFKGKNERLDVQIESHQGEISFLREEQEGDKIRIGDLEAALAGAQTTVQEERERIREMEDNWTEEKKQREALDTQEKAEVQKMLDELNTQLTKAKDEVRKLRKNLSSKEVEATTWKERLEALESGLREALGDLNGTRTNLFKDVVDLQSTLEQTLQTLDSTRADLAEKDRLLRSRDTLLESSGLEVRRITDMLEKERQGRRADRSHFEQIQRGHQSTTSMIHKCESRFADVEIARSNERKRHAAAEQRFNDQILERNNLLLALWNRLSTICGADWAHKHSLVDGELPSLETIAKNLPGFTKNIVLAAKTVETLIGGFRSRIRTIEKDLWKEFQTLEHALDVRVKQLEKLEKEVFTVVKRPSISPRTSSRGSTESSEVKRLKSENKRLKAEMQIQTLQLPSGSAPVSPPRTSEKTRIPSSGSPTSSKHATRASVGATLLRQQSTSAVEAIQHLQELHHHSAPYQPVQPSGASGVPPYRPVDTHSISEQREPLQPSEQRWMHRLKLLERQLKAEREARLLDRSGARKRLEEGKAENDELRRTLEREKERRASLEFELGSAGSPTS